MEYFILLTRTGQNVPYCAAILLLVPYLNSAVIAGSGLVGSVLTGRVFADSVQRQYCCPPCSV